MIRWAIPLAASLALGAAAPQKEASQKETSQKETGVRFTEVTAEAGIRFRHENGAAGGKLLPETMGSGAAWLDFDGDRRLDLLLVNGRSWKPDGEKTTAALYRNRGDGPSGEVTFEDVTRGSGLDVELFGFGAAVADYDGDGRPDVYLTALEGDRLFRNLGDGRFQDVTGAAGIDNRGFGTSAAWLDYDLDGRADLFVANYVTWSPETDQRCSFDGETRSYCTPEVYEGSPAKLWRNLGPHRDGPGAGDTVRFEDASEMAGIADAGAKALGVAVLDYDGDRRPDLFVANDTEPNQLFRNRGPGKGGTVTFEDVALEAGVAYSETGAARGAMGTDAADYDRSGHADLVVANFADEMAALYRNVGPGGDGPGGVDTVRFEDRAPASPVGRATLRTLAFGAFFFDYDLDGWLDVLLANGHIDDGVERVQPRIAFRQPPQLFRNLGPGGDGPGGEHTARFEEVSDRVGADFRQPLVARGAAYGDYDGDGDLDVVVTENGGPARLFRNDGGDRNRWLRVRLLGRRSTPDGLGAVVRVTSASGTQWRAVASGSSYCSESERTLTFGLGRDAEVETLEVEWPSGELQRFEEIAANREVTVDEGKGIVE